MIFRSRWCAGAQARGAEVEGSLQCFDFARQASYAQRELTR